MSRRHSWVRVKVHVYVCCVCGTGKVNARDEAGWAATFHRPDGAEVIGSTPPCTVGPRTAAALTKYSVEISAADFERYLATPYWQKLLPEFDPVRVPAIRERLGQLYETLGKSDKAAENYRAFIALWKNADPELQPRVADAKRRLAKLNAVEKPRR